MTRKQVFAGVLITVMWTGSIWLAFWAGFMCYLSSDVVQSRLDDQVHLAERKMLLSQISGGKVDEAKKSLEDRISIDKEIIKIKDQLGEITPLDMALAGFSPRIPITLLQVQNSSRETLREHLRRPICQ